MPNPEPIKALEKAWQSPNIGKHGKAKKTLMREELKSKATEYLGERLPLLLETIESSIKSGDVNAAFKALEHLIGRPEKSIDVTSKGRPIPLLANLRHFNNGDKEAQAGENTANKHLIDN